LFEGVRENKKKQSAERTDFFVWFYPENRDEIQNILDFDGIFY